MQIPRSLTYVKEVEPRMRQPAVMTRPVHPATSRNHTGFAQETPGSDDIQDK